MDADVAVRAALSLTGGLLAFICGFSLWMACESWHRTKRHKESLMSGEGACKGARADGSRDGSFGHGVVRLMERSSRDIALKHGVRIAPSFIPTDRHFAAKARLAGFLGSVSSEGYMEAKARMALGGAFGGFVVGIIFSAELALVLALVGGVVGWKMPERMVDARIKQRAHETERHLPEMLDVIALGMRSGLSFDSSLKLYASHFDTMLSRELANAQRQWSSGLVRRDEALRKIASTYDSAVFSRVIETVIRSIRHGASMVQGLESDAAEARSAYQAEREERIAKAPVKMMVPTGVLILPAMLIMVLGPVLLELMGGGL